MSVDYEFPFFSTGMNDAEKAVYDEVCFLPTLKLFEEFDKTMDHEFIKDRVRYDVLRGIISDRLGLLHRDVFGPVFAGELAETNDKISELDRKFKNHRHDYSKTFTTKPEW